MRINEEVDALEGMGIRSMPYLVTTRIIAGVVAIVPLYAIGLLSSYLASRYVTVLFNGQSRGRTTTTSTSSSPRRTCCSPY